MLITIEDAVLTQAPQPSASHHRTGRIGRSRSTARNTTTHASSVGAASWAERLIADAFRPGIVPPSTGVSWTEVWYIHSRQAA